MQHDEYPEDHQEYIPDPSVTEEGPWHLYYENGVVRCIASHDFTYDVTLGLSGDFADNKQRERYANEIVSRLNAYGKTTKPDHQIEAHEALRQLTDAIDNLEATGELTIPESLKDTLADARWAVAGHAVHRRRAQLKKIHETVDAIAKKLGVSSLNEELLRAQGVSDNELIKQLLEALSEKF